MRMSTSTSASKGNGSTLREYSVRLRATDGRRDHHFIVPVRAATPQMAGAWALRFIEDAYKVHVTDHLVRYRGRALPTWCEQAKRVTKRQIDGYAQNKRKATSEHMRWLAAEGARRVSSRAAGGRA